MDNNNNNNNEMALFESVLREAFIEKLADAIAKRIDAYDGTDASAQELCKFIKMHLGTAVGTGTDGIVDNTTTKLFDGLTPINKTCALACVRAKNPRIGKQFFARYGKGLGIDTDSVQQAIQLALDNPALSLSDAQKRLKNSNFL